MFGVSDIVIVGFGIGFFLVLIVLIYLAFSACCNQDPKKIKEKQQQEIQENMAYLVKKIEEAEKIGVTIEQQMRDQHQNMKRSSRYCLDHDYESITESSTYSTLVRSKYSSALNISDVPKKSILKSNTVNVKEQYNEIDSIAKKVANHKGKILSITILDDNNKPINVQIPAKSEHDLANLQRRLNSQLKSSITTRPMSEYYTSSDSEKYSTLYSRGKLSSSNNKLNSSSENYVSLTELNNKLNSSSGKLSTTSGNYVTVAEINSSTESGRSSSSSGCLSNSSAERPKKNSLGSKLSTSNNYVTVAEIISETDSGRLSSNSGTLSTSSGEYSKSTSSSGKSSPSSGNSNGRTSSEGSYSIPYPPLPPRIYDGQSGPNSPQVARVPPSHQIPCAPPMPCPPIIPPSPFMNHKPKVSPKKPMVDKTSQG